MCVQNSSSGLITPERLYLVCRTINIRYVYLPVNAISYTRSQTLSNTTNRNSRLTNLNIFYEYFRSAPNPGAWSLERLFCIQWHTVFVVPECCTSFLSPVWHKQLWRGS